MSVRARIGTVVCAFAVVAAAAPAALVDSNSHPFETGFLDDQLFASDPTLAALRVKDAGGTLVRLRLDWSRVAPNGATEPAGFDPTDPNSPGYDWGSFDREVTAAADKGLTPVANLLYAPDWALESPATGMAATVPRPAMFAAFALAAAERYSGATPGLPRVRYWEIWNEPNLALALNTTMIPQFVNGSPYSPGWYRVLVNGADAALKSVHSDNFVIAGSTAPFYDGTPQTAAGNPHWGPLTFMRDVLCLSPELAPTCADPIHFDAWSHHPYISGGPSHHASLADDVSLADLPKMRQALDAAWGVGHIVAANPPALWVTEFGWNSDPPDTNSPPAGLLERWIPEAIYEMWNYGVTVVTWFTVTDSGGQYNAGLYYRGATPSQDTPKPTLQAFRFPFVAYPTRTGARVWGRTPGGRPAQVAVEQEIEGLWVQLGVLQSDQYGIFQGSFNTGSRARVRGRTLDLGETSLPFSLRLVPDQSFTPFGGPALEPPRFTGRPAIPPRRSP